MERRDEVGVLITTQDESEKAVRAAKAIQKSMSLVNESGQGGRRKILKEAIESFKRHDFTGSYEICRKITGEV